MGSKIQLYTTRQMMQAIEKSMAVHSFLRDSFFNAVETFITSSLDVDYKKGKRKMAPFVAPRVGGVVMNRQGFKTRNYKVPKIGPERVISIDDISSRGMGESVYSIKTPAERAAELVGKDLSELEDMIIRREEWMCRELLINGKITMKGIIDDKEEKYIEQEVDFGFTNKDALTDDDKWDNLSTADPHKDLKEKRLTIIKSTGKAPNVVVMNANTAEVFINNAKIQKINDIRRYNFGGIEPKLINDAVTLIAYLPDLNLEIYSYDEWFIGDDGVETAMIPDGIVIIGRKNMGKRLYGSITQIENSEWTTYEAIRVPKMWAEENHEVTKTRLSSRPLPVPEDIDDWYVLDVF